MPFSYSFFCRSLFNIDTVLCISSEKSHRPIYKHTLWNDSFSKIDIKIDFAIGIIPHLLFYAHM